MKKLFSIMLLSTMLFVTSCADSGGQSNAQPKESQEVSKNNETETDVENDEKLKVVFISPETIGVNPFFELMAQGVYESENKFGIEGKVIECADNNAIEENLRLAVAENYDLIITSSFQAEDALTKVATENPSKQFAIIDTVVDLPNVRSIVFREQESSYLLGVVAGLATKTNTVGMVLAADIPLLSKWTVGFEEGLRSVNNDAEFLVNYVGGFTDPAKAKELAILQNSQGADFIVGASAVGDLGVFEAAKENGFYSSGQDTDMTVVDPEHIVMSQLKRTDNVVIETIGDFVNGDFQYGILDYGLAEGGVGLTFVTVESTSPLSPFIGEDIVNQAKEVEQKIISGEIVVTNPLAN